MLLIYYLFKNELNSPESWWWAQPGTRGFWPSVPSVIVATNIIAPRSQSRGMHSNKGRKEAYKCVCASVWEWAENCPHDSRGKSLWHKGDFWTLLGAWLLTVPPSTTCSSCVSKSWWFNIGMELTYFQGLPCFLSTCTHQLMLPKKWPFLGE